MRKIFLVFLCRLVIAAIILEFVHRVTSFDQDPPPFQPLIIIILAVPSVSATVREQESLQDPLNSKNLVQANDTSKYEGREHFQETHEEGQTNGEKATAINKGHTPTHRS